MSSCAFSEDDDNSHSHSTTTGNDNSADNLASKKTTEELAREKQVTKETRAVDRVRLVCFVVFLACATAVCLGMYKFGRATEQSTFQVEYDKFVGDIERMLHWEVLQNFALMEQLASSVTISAIHLGATFPYLTNSEYEVSGGYTDGLSGILSIAFAPLIDASNQTAWEQYAVKNQYWVAEGARYRKIHPEHKDPIDGSFQDHEERKLQELEPQEEQVPRIQDKIFTLDQDGASIPYQGKPGEVLAPSWQIAPTPGDDPKMVNYNLLTDPVVASLYNFVLQEKNTVLSEPLAVDFLFDHAFDASEKWQKKLPHSYVAEPVYETFEEDSKVVGFLVGLTSWENLFNILPEGSNGIHCVVTSSCGGVFTFVLRGPKAYYLGEEDHHEAAYEHHGVEISFLDYEETEDACVPHVTVYPSSELRDGYATSKPIVYTSVIGLAFVFTGILFLMYDRLVTVRQKRAARDAERTSKIVTSLFPATVRDRLLDEAQGAKELNQKNDIELEEQDGVAPSQSRPIADLFPEVTVMFADIAGFTAWSSAREPAQVFELLETLYSAFDEIAKKRRVFKVETIGDCYVAACGLPEPRRDHATVMARFARDCVHKTNQVVRSLTCKLGPGTEELAMRVGLHSGPITGGVLRTENARYQLFGDTMNTAARMESNGKPNRIHVSQDFADLLVAAGKQTWVTRREDVIVAKGKGAMCTFWLTADKGAPSSVGTGSTCSDEASASDASLEELDELVDDVEELDFRTRRLVEWGAQVMIQKLEEVVVAQDNGGQVTPKVASQVKVFVAGIARRYREEDRCPFHNFVHASHVTMSVTKLLSRVATSDGSAGDFQTGLASDALLAFAMIFAALCHDVEHTGVPNTRLAIEDPQLASKFGGKSLAENNSIDIAWKLFTSPRFEAFRACLAPTNGELERFHEAVVHATLATDIVDKNLKDDRNRRWEDAFAVVETTRRGDTADVRVRVVFEHLIQASDVCHTMQHWNIYRVWNEHLFEEMYKAFREGRADGDDPSDFWFQGELGFFDFYIIPLAKKLAQCRVFGVSSDEYLNYARQNRKQWESTGRSVVQGYVDKFKPKYDALEVMRATIDEESDTESDMISA